MKEIKIFLASSIVDFQNERLEIHNFVQELEDILQSKGNDICLNLIKCENMNNRVESERKQNMYNKEIMASDIVLFLFDKTAGDYTLEELEIAAKSSDEENISERICVLCRYDPYNSKDEGLKKLAEYLSKYHILQKQFVHIDTVKLALIIIIIKKTLM